MRKQLQTLFLTTVVSISLSAKNPTPINTTSSIYWESITGFTFYDKQTTGSMPRLISDNSDGTISSCFTFEPTSDPSFPSLSVGYNYFDGSQWTIPEMLYSPSPCHSPTLGVTSTNKEMIICESTRGLFLFHRPVKGVGAWTLDSTLIGTYPSYDAGPRMAVGGSNQETLHLICAGGRNTGSSLHGQTHPILYSRSIDAGQTWAVNDALLSLIDSTHYRGFENGSYNIDVQGNTVAIVFADRKTDIGLLKSMDGGQTWNKSIIKQFPIPFFDDATMTTDTNSDGIADTIQSTAGDPAVLIDPNGMCHVWFSLLDVICTTPGTSTGQGLQANKLSDGLNYWNENMSSGPITIARAYDLNGNGSMDLPTSGVCQNQLGDYHGGITQFPSATIDALGNICVAYQSFAELADTALYFMGHKHGYLISTADYGNTWSTVPNDILPSLANGGDGENQDGCYVSLSRNSSSYNQAVLLYQRDPYPGIGIGSSSCEYSNNFGNSSDIVVSMMDFLNRINEINDEDFSLLLNPTISNGLIRVNIPEQLGNSIQFAIVNSLGKIVDRFEKGPNQSTFTIDISSYAQGFYFLRANSGTGTSTEKFIKN